MMDTLTYRKDTQTDRIIGFLAATGVWIKPWTYLDRKVTQTDSKDTHADRKETQT
jgi:hypothetical protein